MLDPRLAGGPPKRAQSRSDKGLAHRRLADPLVFGKWRARMRRAKRARFGRLDGPEPRRDPIGGAIQVLHSGRVGTGVRGAPARGRGQGTTQAEGEKAARWVHGVLVR